MEYQAIKTNELLIHTTTWMNLENAILTKKKPDRRGHIFCDTTL